MAEHEGMKTKIIFSISLLSLLILGNACGDQQPPPLTSEPEICAAISYLPQGQLRFKHLDPNWSLRLYRGDHLAWSSCSFDELPYPSENEIGRVEGTSLVYKSFALTGLEFRLLSYDDALCTQNEVERIKIGPLESPSELGALGCHEVPKPAIYEFEL